MQIFLQKTSQNIIAEKIKSMPNGGRGVAAKLSKELGIHPTTLSQILTGKRILNLEQAHQISNFFGFSKLETTYLITMVNKERSDNTELAKFFESQLKELSEQSKNLINRVSADTQISDVEQNTFYSSWEYTAIRNLSAINQYGTIEEIANRLNIPAKKVSEIIEFLLKSGLCKYDKNNKITIGPQVTHLSSSATAIKHHHINWRLKNIDRVNKLDKEELMYTSISSLSSKDCAIIQENIIQLIEKTVSKIKSSPSEELRSFCVDWVKV